jgi:hypothetical protein
VSVLVSCVQNRDFRYFAHFGQVDNCPVCARAGQRIVPFRRGQERYDGFRSTAYAVTKVHNAIQELIVILIAQRRRIFNEYESKSVFRHFAHLGQAGQLSPFARGERDICPISVVDHGHGEK